MTLPSSGNPSVQNSLQDGLVAHYPGRIGDAGLLVDESGNGHHADPKGVRFSDSGPTSKAIRFDGEEAHLVVSDPLKVQGAFSISLWVRLDGLGNPHQRILGNRLQWQSDQGFEMEVSPYSSSINLSGANTGADTQGAVTVSFDEGLIPSPPLRLVPEEIHPKWMHLTGVMDEAGVIRLYLNGEKTLEKNGVALARRTDVPLFIGAAPEQTESGDLKPKNLFRGAMADLRIYNRVLTQGEITHLAGMIKDPEAFEHEQSTWELAYQEQLTGILRGPGLTVTETERKDAQTIRQRFKDFLITNFSGDSGTIEMHFRTQKPDGSWPDLDYASQQPSEWPPGVHLRRLQQMGGAYRSGNSPISDDPAALEALKRGIQFYTENGFHAENWWWNEIGAPQIGMILLYLIGDEMDQADEARIKSLIKDPLRYGERPTFTGQNLIWRGSIVFLTAIWNDQISRARRAMDEIIGEIRITEGEGLQIDGSFHQHGPQLYTHGYGASFAGDLVQLIYLTRQTVFELPPREQTLLDLLILDGQQWMVRSGFRDPMAMGRNIARPGATGIQYLQRDYPLAAGLQAEMNGPRQPEYQAYLDRLNGDGSPLVGHRMFWRSDFSTHHRPGFYISVKGTSTRMWPNETGNFENLKGRLLADGVTTLVRHGGEYADIYPVWDWRHIPGATSVGTPEVEGWLESRGTHPFVGGVTNGQQGIHAMVTDATQLKAKKAWFLTDWGMVCLGAGIDNLSDEAATTTLNQVFQKSDVRVLDGGSIRELPEGAFDLEVEAVEHDEIVYWLPDRETVHLSAQEQQGSWHEINHAYSKEILREPVFKLHLEHAAKNTGQSYHYAVFPGMRLEEFQAEKKPFYHVVENTENLQAIEIPEENMLFAVFHQPGDIEWNGSVLSVDIPCLVMVKSGQPDRIFVSDPSQTRTSLNLVWKGIENTVELPQASMAGSSIQLKLKTDDNIPASERPR